MVHNFAGVLQLSENGKTLRNFLNSKPVSHIQITGIGVIKNLTITRSIRRRLLFIRRHLISQLQISLAVFPQIL